MVGPRAALAELAHLDPDPARVGPVDVDALSFRGVFRLLAGDLGQAVGDLTASLKMARNGAVLTLGLRTYFYLALAQYLSGAWDDVLLTAEQGFSATEIRSRRFELPLLHLAAGYAVLWRPLLAEGLIGSGQTERAAAVLHQLRANSGQVSYVRTALAWLDGWLAEQQGDPEQARQSYAHGEDADAQSPVFTAWLLLAHGRLLRRTGNRKEAVDRCAGRTTCTRSCGPRRSSPGRKRNWWPATCPPPGPRSGLFSH